MFVMVPSSSKYDEAGKITSASAAVSEINKSIATKKDSCSMAFLIKLACGPD